VTDSEITTTILRQIRDDVREVKADVRSLRADALVHQDEVRGEFSVVHTLLRDAAGRLVTIVRYLKNRHEPALLDLRKRVVKLEKKVG
jgi:hypothetical protein